MIQRIQTLLLLLVTGVSAALLFVPFVRYELSPSPVEVSLLPAAGNGDKLSGLYYLPVALNLIILVFSVYVILQFRRRILQMKLASILMALSAILLGVMLLFDFISPAPGAPALLKKYLAGAYLPILSVLAAFLAARAIKKDEELVRSADRLR